MKACFLTSADLREEFKHEDAKWHDQEHTAVEKEKQKEADTAQHAIHVADDALNRVFSGCLASYKKGNLRALALAPSLSNKCTNAELLS